MSHRPVCVKCQVEMRPEKSGVGLLDMASYGPYKLWESDLYKCPKCGCEIITGFGDYAITEHYEPSFTRILQAYKDKGLVVENREYNVS